MSIFNRACIDMQIMHSCLRICGLDSKLFFPLFRRHLHWFMYIFISITTVPPSSFYCSKLFKLLSRLCVFVGFPGMFVCSTCAVCSCICFLMTCFAVKMYRLTASGFGELSVRVNDTCVRQQGMIKGELSFLGGWALLGNSMLCFYSLCHQIAIAYC